MVRAIVKGNDLDCGLRRTGLDGGQARVQSPLPRFPRRHALVRGLPAAIARPGRGAGYLPVILLIMDWNNEPGLLFDEVSSHLRDARFFNHHLTIARGAALAVMSQILAQAGNASSAHRFGRRQNPTVDDARELVAGTVGRTCNG